MKKAKQKVKIKNNETFDYMKTNKDNLNNILLDKSILPIINDLVSRTNKIVIHTYQYLKMYCLHLYHNNRPLPLIDKEFICDIFKVVTQRKCNSGGYTENNMPTQLKNLKQFYDLQYKLTINTNEILYYDGLSYILAYEAIDMITNINNNIQMHFIDHLNKYVNIVYDVKGKAREITKQTADKETRKELHKQLYNEFKKVKNDLITFNDFTCDEKYHDWINEQHSTLFPNKTSFDKDSIHYDIKSKTQDYLISMFYLSNEIEKMNIKIINDNLQNGNKNRLIRQFNVLPMRTNIVPKFICIDTCALISNFYESTADYLKRYKKDNLYHQLWSKYFSLNKRVFKKNKYVFRNMIRTDGIGCCILFIRTDENGKALPKTINNKNSCGDETTEYIEKIKITPEMRQTKIITVDPGMSDLIYCGSHDNNGNLETFRYTLNQRRVETKKKKYNNIIDTINKTTTINNQTVKEIEAELSAYSKKICNIEKYKQYITKKNETNDILNKHYEQSLFRKLKLNSFINTQKSESKMVKNLKNKFDPMLTNNIMIVMGDYDKGNNNMKNKEPIICKKFRRIFKNARVETYLINEYRTSKLCNECHEELEKFMIRESHKPIKYKNKETELVHGLLRCQSVKHECEVYHNRDKNAVQNMLNIVKSIFETGKRLTVFSRTE